MPNRSLNDRLTVKRCYGGSYTTTQTPATGTYIGDLHTAEIVVDLGAITNIANSPKPSWAFSVLEGDTAGGAFTAVAEADLVLGNGNNDGSVTAGVFATANAADEDDKTYRCGYVGRKAYLKVVATAADTPGATPIAVSIIGEAKIAPQADA